MYKMNGFAEFGPLFDNAEGVIAKLGELSPLARTYAKEKTAHTAAEYQVVQLITFHSESNNAHTPPTGAYANKVLEIFNWIYLQAVDGAFSNDSDNFQQLFLGQWQSQVTLKETGAMITNGALWMPEWITFSLSAFPDNESTVWTCNDSFLTQYAHYTNVFVQTTPTMDGFFDSLTAVRNMVNAISLSYVTERVATVAGDYPYTRLRTDVFDWVYPTDPSVTIPVDFVTIIYGEAGNNLDATKETIIAYLLANSTHSQSEWAALFPDLFTSTEFIVSPFWDNYAIPNETLETGLGSSVTRLPEIALMATASGKGPGYTPTHITSVTQIIATTYKGYNAVVLAGADNRTGAKNFLERFPDYMGIATGNPDFRRLSQYTRDFIVELLEMFKIAETMTGSAPIGYTRVVRSGVVYLSRTYQRIQYLVPLKSNHLLS